MNGFSKLLVPVDFSPVSRATIDMALKVLAPGGQLDLLHVWHTPFPVSADLLVQRPDVPLQRLGDWLEVDAQRAMERVLQEVPLDGVRCEQHFVGGDPARVIVDRAGQGGYDAIVMGRQGRSAISRWMLGSVSERVVRKAPCPIVLVPELLDEGDDTKA